MKISILSENVAGENFEYEHGLSYLIEIDGEKILFDSGASDIFLKNAELLGVDIHKDVQTVVLSHGHWDHSGGLKHLKNKKLITHPDSFKKRLRKNDNSFIGNGFSKEQIQNNFKLQETSTPVQITKNLFFLGQIPRLNDFESQNTPFKFEDNSDDFVNDDSALAAISNNKLVIITGCSHSGICNICEYAKKVSGISEIETVIGGFHLRAKNRQTFETINYLKKNEVSNVLPSHCTSFSVIDLFRETFEIRQVKTGMTFQF